MYTAKKTQHASKKDVRKPHLNFFRWRSWVVYYYYYYFDWMIDIKAGRKKKMKVVSDESVWHSAKLLILDRSQCQRFHGLSKYGQTSPWGREREIFTFPRHPVEFHFFWHLPSVLDSSIKEVWQEYKMPQRQTLPIFQGKLLNRGEMLAASCSLLDFEKYSLYWNLKLKCMNEPFS